ncbi:hypothetical protein NE237_030983 [Protea cynaroides]|uniref:PIK-related kinase FAT domain-containing protein n=1 Tax=Protea cynaroides TaxID=273540 RepID=A0A9Q0JWA6_9MAGN|nr:hypothetical protein NE237_030983 [Protea cynaroides]
MDEYLSEADGEGLLCSSAECNASFDMDVAKILQAMMKKDQFSVAEKIAQSKQALLAPLAAAGMDSYMQAYPFAMKLHLLHELEDFHAFLLNESFLERAFHLDDPMCTAKLLWDTRRSDGAIAELQQSLLNMLIDIVGSAAISSISSLSLVPLNQPSVSTTQAS